ncbi:hypothetical protein J6590_074484 [Homalodisca vitripennis]|nr:hypothetical protein J6590_074484 [Homalodisca vitripennis]
MLWLQKQLNVFTYKAFPIVHKLKETTIENCKNFILDVKVRNTLPSLCACPRIIAELNNRGLDKSQAKKWIHQNHLSGTGKPLSKEKIKDLKEILKLVPQDLKNFYNFLRTAEQGEFDDDVDGFEVTNVDFEIDNDDN